VRLLTFTTLYPNSAQPFHGLFVERRLRRLLATGGVEAQVVAPVPWFPWGGGAFGRYAKFARAPSAEDVDGLRVTHPRYPVIPKIGMSVAPALMARALGRHVSGLLHRGKFDLIDAHYFYPDGVAAARIARKAGRPVVITARGSDINLLANYKAPRRQILRAAADAAAIITVSDALRVKLIELGVADEKITVLRNGVDLAAFRPEARAATESAGPILLSVGNLVNGKGHDVAIRAVAGIAGARLVIVGDGPLRHELVALAQGQQVAERVTFLGQVDQDALRTCYNTADATILASAREGMPNVVLESLACGTPVIASHVGGIPEVLTSDVAGVLLERSSPDCLRAAILALRERRLPKSAVREFALRFAWEPTINAQIALYRKVLADASLRGAPK
jgi:glycosyltransferase involved in cell wall biosynthesis